MSIKTNSLNIIGTLASIERIEGVSDKSGSPVDYVRGSLSITVKLPTKTMTIPVSFYAAKITKAGNPRKLVKQINDLVLGQRIAIQGTINENKFWIADRDQMAKTKKINLVFINDAKELPDTATFDYAGFVYKPLKEVFDKDAQSTGQWTISLGQATYLNEYAEIMEFNVDAADRNAIAFIEREYTAGKTVHVVGDVHFDVETVTRSEKADFGPDKVTVYQKNVSILTILSGIAIINADDDYTSEEMSKLVDGIAVNDRKVIEDQKNREQKGESVSTAKPATATATKVPWSLV